MIYPNVELFTCAQPCPCYDRLRNVKKWYSSQRATYNKKDAPQVMRWKRSQFRRQALSPSWRSFK